MDDDKERRKGEETGGVNENRAERGRRRHHRKTVSVRHDVSQPTYITNDIISMTFFFWNRHISRSLLFRLAVHTLLFCASVMLSGSLGAGCS